MNTHIERIRKLVALQHVDDDIHAIEQELRKAPEEVEELARRFAEQEELRNRILDKLQHLREQQKRIEQDIEGESSRIKKSKSKLMQVENDREYQAVVREMDNMERQSRGREEDRMGHSGGNHPAGKQSAGYRRNLGRAQGRAGSQAGKS